MPNIRNIEWPDVDWDDSILVEIPRLMIPYVVGLWEKLHYRALYLSDDDWQRAEQDITQLELLVGQGESTMTILEQLTRMAVALEEVPDLLVALQCICNLPDAVNQANNTTVINNYYMQEQLTAGRSIYGPEDAVQGEGDPPTGYASWGDWENARCGLAQGFYLCTLETWIASLSKARAAISLTLGAIDVVLYTAYGVTVPLAIAFDAFMAFVMEGPATEADDGVVTTLESMKQDLVCALYSNTSSVAAAAAAQAVIDENLAGLTPISYIWLKALFSAPMIQLYFDGGGDFQYTGSIIPGYCQLCEELVIGSDWYAIPVYGPDWTWTLAPGEDTTTHYCWEDYEVPGKYIAGVIFELTVSQTGYAMYGLNTRSTAGCGSNDYTWWPDSAEQWSATGFYAHLDPLMIDETECAAEFDATYVQQNNRHTGLVQGAHRMRALGGHSITLTVKYVVVEGSPT